MSERKVALKTRRCWRVIEIQEVSFLFLSAPGPSPHDLPRTTRPSWPPCRDLQTSNYIQKSTINRISIFGCSFHRYFLVLFYLFSSSVSNFFCSCSALVLRHSSHARRAVVRSRAISSKCLESSFNSTTSAVTPFFIFLIYVPMQWISIYLLCLVKLVSLIAQLTQNFF